MERSKNETGAGLEISQAAAALGRIGGKSRSARKHASSQVNMLKAQKASTGIPKEKRIERAKKAAAARWAKARKTDDNEQ